MGIKKKKGISLIVLVITIVVMIILATVIILSLSGSGIIDNAKEARDKSDNANLKDAAIVAYSEWRTARELGKTELNGHELTGNPKDYIGEVLEDAGFTELERDKVEIEDGKIATDYIAFYIKDTETNTTVKYRVKEGTTWEEFAEANAENFEQRKSGFRTDKAAENSDVLMIEYSFYPAETGGDTYYILKENKSMNVSVIGTGKQAEYALANPQYFFKVGEKIEEGRTYYQCYYDSLI